MVKRIRFKPHNYQKTAIDFLEERKKALLILDMGLGKTVITLTALRDGLNKGKYHRPLIVAPKIVSENTWAHEFKKWEHLRDVKYLELDAQNTKQRLSQYDRITDGTVTIVSESKIQWLMDMYAEEQQRSYIEDDYEPRAWQFDCIVLDEISMFKNPSTARYKNLYKKVNTTCKYVIGLTGTPTPNGLADLWSIMMLIDKGKRLGKTKQVFRKKYCSEKRIKLNSGNNQQYIKTYDVKEAMYNNILDAVSDIALAMKSEDYLDVKRPDIIPIPVTLSEEGMKFYNQLTVKKIIEMSERENEDERVAKRISKLQRRIKRLGNGIDDQMKKARLEDKIDRLRPADDIIRISADGILAAIGKARQLAGGAVYEDLPDIENEDEYKEALKNRRTIVTDTEKVNKLVDVIERHKHSSPVLIFIHYKHEANRIKELYPDAEVLNTANAQKILPRWNRGEIPVLIANAVSTKFGLNMQDGGHVIVWYGLNYSFEEFTQANARLARQGQSKRVQIYIFEALNTIDSDIAQVVQDKQSRNSMVYDYLKEDGLQETSNDVLAVAQKSMQNLFEQETGQKLEIG